MPSGWTLRVLISMTNATYNRFSATVPAWKKSIASRLPAWARRKVRQVSSRRVDGGTLLAQDLADGRGGHPMAEATQFTLDANHAPGPVLPRQAHDQGGQLLAGRRTARRLRLPPPRGDQPAVPAQQRSRRDNPVGA